MLCTIIRVVEPISSSLQGETLPSHAVFTSACPRRHPGVRHQSYADLACRDLRLSTCRRHRAARRASRSCSTSGPHPVGDGAGCGPRRGPVTAVVGDAAGPPGCAPARGLRRLRGRQRPGMARMARPAHRRADLLPGGGADPAASVVVDLRDRVGADGVCGRGPHGPAPVAGRRAHRLLGAAWLVWRGVRSGSTVARVAGAGLAGFAVMSLVDHPANATGVATLMWLLLGLVAGVRGPGRPASPQAGTGGGAHRRER